MNKIAYVGAGLHITPVCLFKDCQEFIFMDSRPRNPHGQKEYIPATYDKLFEDDLINKFEAIGWRLGNRVTYGGRCFSVLLANPTCFEFHENCSNRVVRYYASATLLYDMNKTIAADLADVDAIIIRGHDPHDSLLRKYIKTEKIYIIGYSDSWWPYNHDKNISGSLTNYLACGTTRVLGYIAIDIRSTVCKLCESYSEFYNTIEHYYNKQLQFDDCADN